MNQKSVIVLPEHTRVIAEERPREEGFDSVEMHLSALIEEDRETGVVHDWMRERIRSFRTWGPCPAQNSTTSSAADDDSRDIATFTASIPHTERKRSISYKYLQP